MSALLLPKVLDSLCVEDVTKHEEKLHSAFQLVSASYTKFSSRRLSLDEVYAEICQDEYHCRDLARTIILTGLSPSSDYQHIEMLATVRIVLGTETSTASTLPLEAMRLITPNGGWDNFIFADFNPYKAIEYARLAIRPDCRRGIARAQNFHLYVTQQLITGAYKIATQQFGKSQAWAIMPHFVAKTIEAAGINLIQVPGITLNYQQNQILFEKYDKYWISQTPEYYKLDFNAEK